MFNLGEYKEKLANMDTESKKKIFIFGGIFIGVIILIIIISIIVAIINRRTSYLKVEEMMTTAGYKYYQDNPGKLPTGEVKTTSVSVDTLVSEEYIKDIKKMTKDDSCTGEVIVTNMGDDYDYQGFLKCGDFKTSYLIDQVKKNNPIVDKNDGLYNEDGILRFRGEYVKNYLKIGETLYRIVKINPDNKMYIILDETDDSNDELYIPWDDRYNTQEDRMCGINDYSLSRIKRTIEQYYNKLDNNVKNNTTTFNACYGGRSKEDSNNTGQSECSRMLENVNVSLLPLYDYMKASLAPGCQTPSSQECRNYNYLVGNDSSWWTSTGDTKDTSSVYYVSSVGEIDSDKADARKAARYVLLLKANAIYSEGNGTKKNPYQIR